MEKLGGLLKDLTRELAMQQDYLLGTTQLANKLRKKIEGIDESSRKARDTKLRLIRSLSLFYEDLLCFLAKLCRLLPRGHMKRTSPALLRKLYLIH